MQERSHATGPRRGRVANGACELAYAPGVGIFSRMSSPHPAPLSDTAPEAAGLHARLVAALTPAERTQRMRELTLGASLTALAGLRRRYPGATDRELLLRLAVLRLGAEVVARVYGWRSADGA